MKSKKLFFVVGILFISHLVAFGQNNLLVKPKIVNHYTYRLSFPIIILSNIGSGDKRTNTQHVELHFKYARDSKNIFGLKFATWRLFQPMGILWWDGLLDKIVSKSEYYPGYLRETGVGLSYQRMLWKGLFGAIEILPLSKSYLDLNENKLANGFKLYSSYHIGYHLSFLKNRIFIEPQIHCQNWMFDTNTPSQFEFLDNQWRKYFLFEPNIYLGAKF